MNAAQLYHQLLHVCMYEKKCDGLVEAVQQKLQNTVKQVSNICSSKNVKYSK